MPDAHDGPWATELTEVVRAASGGLLFGVPLLYTMEVWWTGTHTSAGQMLVILGLLMIPVLALNRTGGFRTSRDLQVADAIADTVEAVAVGLVMTTVVLVLLREITVETPVAVALGKVVYESIPFCIGVGVARHFLARGRDQDDDDGDQRSPEEALNGTAADLGATALGAVFIALSIAPTDEVPLIASTMDPKWLLLLMGASLATSYAIVFAAGFSRQDQRHSQRGVLQRPLTETVACYLVALVVSAFLLWVFQRGLHPWTDLLRRTVVLGFPAAVGGAAGRLAV